MSAAPSTLTVLFSAKQHIRCISFVQPFSLCDGILCFHSGKTTKKWRQKPIIHASNHCQSLAWLFHTVISRLARTLLISLLYTNVSMGYVRETVTLRTFKSRCFPSKCNLEPWRYYLPHTDSCDILRYSSTFNAQSLISNFNAGKHPKWISNVKMNLLTVGAKNVNQKWNIMTLNRGWADQSRHELV